LRGLSHFQGVVLLAERCMSAEAQSLARGTLETAFCLQALIDDEAFIDQLISADVQHRKNIAKTLTSGSQREFLDAGAIAELEKHLTDLKNAGQKSASLKIEQIAKKAGLHETYETIYRALSGDGTHVSAQALNRCLSEEPCGKLSINFGPCSIDIDYTLQTACMSLHICLEGTCSLLNIQGIKGELTELRGEYVSLTKAMVARRPM
jgi:Family of unknown function (DUF5677)